MATLVLTAIGTAVGGPLGGALGALVGQQADRALFGGSSREGPRLKELSVTTSSYGQPIARHFGRMRVAGTVIWATDLSESSSTEGGKGKPKTTTYSYSANFAVALSSTPILDVGRVWADGNLLRGSSGDLKVEGELRIYLGHGNDQVDPLISADQGATTPAFRDCAYVVFENLQLADFGNRIPALTFEIISDLEPSLQLSSLLPEVGEHPEEGALDHVLGFADEGGPLSGTLSSLRKVFPLVCKTSKDGLSITTIDAASDDVSLLPEKVSVETNAAEERFKSRGQTLGKEPLALRYYDDGRDYQPGVQRTIGRRPLGQEVVIDLPATLNAEGAKALAVENTSRARWQNEKMIWRIAELDPSIQSGSLVYVPDTPGLWLVDSWEWNDESITLELTRVVNATLASTGSDGGATRQPIDISLGRTELLAFELPPESSSDANQSSVFVAASSASTNWHGAALYREQGSVLQPVGSVEKKRATIGLLTEALGPSTSLFFEPEATVDLQLIADDLVFDDTDISGLASGANRLMVGGEALQFQRAIPLGAARWRLCGLLRGRAGTEWPAQIEHPPQTPVILLNEYLTPISQSQSLTQFGDRLAAIGRGDEQAVFAEVMNAGLSLRPLTPVHPRAIFLDDTSVQFCWTRRARGHWQWDYGYDVPLVEQTETYLVGYGPVASPRSAFTTHQPSIVLTQEQLSDLSSQYGADSLWVSQIGTYARSQPLLLKNIN